MKAKPKIRARRSAAPLPLKGWEINALILLQMGLPGDRAAYWYEELESRLSPEARKIGLALLHPKKHKGGARVQVTVKRIRQAARAKNAQDKASVERYWGNRDRTDLKPAGDTTRTDWPTPPPVIQVDGVRYEPQGGSGYDWPSR